MKVIALCVLATLHTLLINMHDSWKAKHSIIQQQINPSYSTFLGNSNSQLNFRFLFIEITSMQIQQPFSSSPWNIFFLNI